MASINFECHGGRQGGHGSVTTTTGVNSASIPGWNNDRIINVTLALAATLGVAPGWYEVVSLDSSGNRTYAPANRGNI